MAWNVGVSLVFFAFGLGLGFLLAYWRAPRDDSRIKELEQELAELRQAHDSYRQTVYQHFEQTGQMFQDLTVRYRALYDHLAHGAQDLCEQRPDALSLDLSRSPALEDQGGMAAPGEPPAAPGPDEVTQPRAPEREEGTEDESYGDLPHVPEVPREDEEADTSAGDRPGAQTARAV